MKKLVFLMGIVLMGIPFISDACTPTPGPTGIPIPIGFNIDVHFGCKGLKANDFHVEGIVQSIPGGPPPVVKDIWLYSDGESGTWEVVPGSPTLVEDPPDSGLWLFTLDMKIKENDTYIYYCSFIHFGIMFDVQSYIQIIDDFHGWWTLDGEEVVCPVPLSGFGVDDENQIVTIYNDSDSTIEIIALEIAVVENQVPLIDMDRDGLGLPVIPSPTPTSSSTPDPTSSPTPTPAVTEPPKSIISVLDYLREPDPIMASEYSQIDWKVVENLPVTLEPDSTLEVDLEDLEIQLSPGQCILIRGRQIIEGAVDEKWAHFWEQRGVKD